MTDPITEEAVEAAARAYLRGDRMGVGENSGRHRSGILSALTAAAPYIAAQERTTASAMTELFKAEHEKNHDLLARIEALRDEWRAESDHSGRALHDQDADYDVGYLRARQAVHASHADALDALLRGAMTDDQATDALLDAIAEMRRDPHTELVGRLRALIEQWRAEAFEDARDAQATAIERCADELERAIGDGR